MLSRPDSRPSLQHISQSVGRAAALIPPAWPLKATVAVNPFLGHSKNSFSETSERIRNLTGQGLTLPRDWYLQQIRNELISTDDLASALSGTSAMSPEAFKAVLCRPAEKPDRFSSILDLASERGETDLSELAMDCIGNWAAAFFDEGQALWTPRSKQSAWQDWRICSRHDLTPEIYGLTQFAERSDETPDRAMEFIAQAVDTLRLPVAALEPYFHHLLFDLLGWSQLARYQHWQAELDGGTDDTLTDLLAIRLFWDVAVYTNRESDLAPLWQAEVDRYAQAGSGAVSEASWVDEVLQTALDRSVQRRLADEFSRPASARASREPFAQVAFCIDVRSEPMRRAMEACSDQVETIGFAGFFGLPIDHDPFASDQRESRLPVLLSPALKTRTEANDTASDLSTRYSARAVRAWGRFKLAAVSSFAFVEAAGALYLARLVEQQFLPGKKKVHPDPKPVFTDTLSRDTKTALAKSILGAMSLTSGFRELVVLCGHGASVTNNPHESALHCGACGGYTGDVSARLLAGLLNDPETRAGLAGHNILIPEDTRFIGALHNTTTDDITLFEDDVDLSDKASALADLKDLFRQAALVNRTERQPRLPGARDQKQVMARSLDWAQTRPEWGLAGCKSFIAAPRVRTAGRKLDGEAFLHSYDWRQDTEFKVLELILTAPVVVASWISLQYFGSTVAPDTYGAGNKLLHNVVGGMGVLEGNSGPLRTGLPIQSVHDGADFIHLPVRLSVIIEAPEDAINTILRNHEHVRDLFDNQWLHLFRMDDHGRLCARYGGGFSWTSLSPKTSTTATKELAA